MKRTAMLLCLITGLFLFVFPAGAFTARIGDPAQGAVFVCSSSGLCRVSLSDHTARFERTVPDGADAEITSLHPIALASVFGDDAVAVCNDFANRQIVVMTCDLRSGAAQSFAIANRKVASDTGFWYGGSEIFLPDENRPSVINRFSAGGMLLNSYDFGADAAILCGYRSELYAVSDRTLYRFEDNAFIPLDGALYGAGAGFVAQDVLADLSGNIYRVSDGAVRLMFRAESGVGYAAAVSPDGAVYVADRSVIDRYDGATGRRTDYFETGGRIGALYYYDGNVVAAFAEDTQYIPPERFLPCPEEIPFCPVTSSVYTVDAVNYRITRISAPTTFAQFKSAVNHAGYQVQLFRDGKAIASGSVGTAMTAVFSGADSYTFELSVIGDITGEGNVNSRDVGELIDFFLGTLRFDGVYLDAADLSGDGEVDLTDLALLCRRAN